MPSRSLVSIPVSHMCLPSFIFKSPSAPLSTRPIFVDSRKYDSHYLSLSSYRQWSKRVAAGLILAGLKPGDRVLLYAENSIFFPVIMMGVIMAGGIFSAADPSYGTGELLSQLKDAAPHFFIAEGNRLSIAIEAAAISDIGKSQMFIFDDRPFDGGGDDEKGVRHWRHLIASAKVGEEFAWQEFQSGEEANGTATIVYTTGTSGIAKGVEVTHLNYIASCTHFNYAVSLHPTVFKAYKEARTLCPTGMHRIVAQTIVAVMVPQGAWGTVYIMPRFEYLPMVEIIDKLQITYLQTGPSVLDALARDPLTRDGSRNISSLRTIDVGGARVRKHSCEEFSRIFDSLWGEGKLRVGEGWGMTETVGGVITLGLLNPNCEAKVMDFSGKQETPVGRKGELWVRGPTVMKGYWQNTNLTKEKLTTDGWFKTGDVAKCDEKGKFSIIDRVKDLITTEGGALVPTEVEEILLEHDSILDAGVIELPSDEPHKMDVYVVRTGERDVTRAEIMDLIWTRVPEARGITGEIDFVDEIPRKDDGKILRRFLRERASSKVKA